MCGGPQQFIYREEICDSAAKFLLRFDNKKTFSRQNIRLMFDGLKQFKDVQHNVLETAPESCSNLTLAAPLHSDETQEIEELPTIRNQSKYVHWYRIRWLLAYTISTSAAREHKMHKKTYL